MILSLSYSTYIVIVLCNMFIDLEMFLRWVMWPIGLLLSFLHFIFFGGGVEHIHDRYNFLHFHKHIFCTWRSFCVCYRTVYRVLMESCLIWIALLQGGLEDSSDSEGEEKEDTSMTTLQFDDWLSFRLDNEVCSVYCLFTYYV